MLYRSLRSIQPWGVVPPTSHKVSRVSWYSGSCRCAHTFTYGAFTLSGRPSQAVLLVLTLTCAVRNPSMHARWFGLFRFRSPLLPESMFLGYLDVSVRRVPRITLWIHVMLPEGFSGRFPHSEISGSMDICSSPKLFAAYHVFHRLLVPRHPPCALFCLTLRRIALRLPGLLHFHTFALPWRISLKSSSLYPYMPAFAGPYGLGCLDICFVRYAVFKVRADLPVQWAQVDSNHRPHAYQACALTG